MNEKQRLIKEIEQAPDFLVKEVLDFLLSTKNKPKYLKFGQDSTLVSRSLLETNPDEGGKGNTALARNSEKSLKSLLLEIPNVGEDSDFDRVLDLGRNIDL